MNEREPLLVLMDKALKSKKMFLEYSSLGEIIADEKKCASILRRVLNDESFEIPNGKHYEIVQGRAEHSMINYVLGLVFREFADLFECIDVVVEKNIMRNKKAADEAWFSVALNHDVGYFRKHILDENLDYEKVHKYYLFKDDYVEAYERKYDCLNGMSSQVPALYAFTYSEILEYDVKDRERRRNSSGYEKINHGIYGGADFFDRMLRKFDKEDIIENEAVKMVKAVAITIAQHNLYKSNSTENNHFYPSKLWYESDFVIGKEYRGNDNFFQYMSGTFDVDFIDADNAIDNCSTDRKSLAWDSFENDELITLNLLMEKLVTIAQKKWREQRKAEKKKKLKNNGQEIDKWLESLTPVERPLAKKITTAILENDDIAEDVAAEYLECIKDMYGFEGFKQFTLQLDELDELDNEKAIKLLTDWTNIEAKEYAKIAIGRIKTIEQFEKFIRANASERDVIQKFLEEFPWLLDPKMSKFEREVTYTRILKENFNDDYLPESNRRLDFLCTDESGVIHVIELKRPNIRITLKEIQQIAEYVKFLKLHYPYTISEIRGYLISDNMKFDDGVDIIIDGLRTQNIYIKSYSDLLAEARRYNKSLYDMYTKIDEAKGKP